MKKTSIMAGFGIFGDNVNPDIVTKTLNINPTICWNKGDYNQRFPKSIGDRGYNIYKYGLWEVNTGYEESRDMNTEIRKIYTLLEKKINEIREIQDEYNAKCGVSIVIKVRSVETPDMHFERWFIDFLHDIKGEVDIDLYVYSETTEE